MRFTTLKWLGVAISRDLSVYTVLDPMEAELNSFTESQLYVFYRQIYSELKKNIL